MVKEKGLNTAISRCTSLLAAKKKGGDHIRCVLETGHEGPHEGPKHLSHSLHTHTRTQTPSRESPIPKKPKEKLNRGLQTLAKLTAKEQGDASLKNSHVVRQKDTPKPRECPLKVGHVSQNCKKARCAWFSFDDDECAAIALVKIVNSFYEWETERS